MKTCIKKNQPTVVNMDTSPIKTRNSWALATQFQSIGKNRIAGDRRREGWSSSSRHIQICFDYRRCNSLESVSVYVLLDPFSSTCSHFPGSQGHVCSFAVVARWDTKFYEKTYARAGSIAERVALPDVVARLSRDKDTHEPPTRSACVYFVM